MKRMPLVNAHSREDYQILCAVQPWTQGSEKRYANHPDFIRCLGKEIYEDRDEVVDIIGKLDLYISKW